MARALKTNGRAAKLAGKAVRVDCGACCEPVPSEPWVKGTLCDCSSSSETEAWMRTSDYLALRAQGTCPTGRLADNSCWEILPGAETRDTEPPAAQQLVPSGVGGCCLCCRDCGTFEAGTRVLTGCPRSEERGTIEVCCPDGALINEVGYTIETLWRYGDACDGLFEIREAWWRQSSDLADPGEFIVRRRRRESGGCALTRIEEYFVDGSGLSRPTCDGVNRLYDAAIGFGQPAKQDLTLRAVCDPPGFPTCPNTQYRIEFLGPIARANISNGDVFRGCLPAYRAYSIATQRFSADPCVGRCRPGAITPVIPAPPSGGDSPSGPDFVRLDSGLFAPDNEIRRSTGCNSCGKDGGL